MKLVDIAVSQPVTIAVGVLLSLLAGGVAITRVPIQMTPEVQSVVISVTTNWENASPEEIESDVVEQQEQKLGDVSGLASLTSISQAGFGQIRLEFQTGTDIKKALSEVDQKLSEVPSYPVGVDEPQIEDIDPESVDYISWIGLASTDPEFDPTTLYDFMERRLRPRLERIQGVAQVGIRGAREAEVQIRVDPVRLAQYGITWAELVDAIDLTNDNYSGGRLPDGKNDVRVRAVGRFRDVGVVREMVVRRDPAGPIRLRDVAEVERTHKEVVEWVRARGHRMPFFNFQLELGGNLLETMAAIDAEVERMEAPGGPLEQESKALGLNGRLELVKTYDATEYVNDALALVRSNVVAGGILATLTLLLFLRSLRTIGIIALAIPISTIGAVVVLVALGRTMNIISLAGMAFATGMVVDNAIVVIENVFRHLELGKTPRRAALDGTKEVAGAVLASTLTTLIVFLPILLIQEAAGQLFRDIALAIMAAVGLSWLVSITVVPSAAAKLLRAKQRKDAPARPGPLRRMGRALAAPFRWLGRLPAGLGGFVHRVNGSWIARGVIVAAFAVVTVWGIRTFIAPLDYLPKGNRNFAGGVLIPPPGYTVDQLTDMGKRIEARLRPAWERAGDRFGIEAVARGGGPPQPGPLPLVSPGPGQPATIEPPPIDHYFLVAFEGRLFHGVISGEKERVADALAHLDYAVAGEAAPDVIAFSFQFPLFRTGGTTGSAIKIDLSGDDFEAINGSAAALMFRLAERFGPYAVTPEPANFLLPTQELRIVPDDARLREMGMSRRDVGLAVQASGDGLLLPRAFELEGELKDVKLITPAALGDAPLDALLRAPMSTPGGRVIDLGAVAEVTRVTMPDRIKRVNRQRAVTLQLTPPAGIPLQIAIDDVNAAVAELREAGAVRPGVQVALAGSAGNLAEIRRALLGDGTWFGTLSSSFALALIIVYLLMVVLFQSWTYPLVILVTVPLATFGGFLALAAVHAWSVRERYMPIQNLDVLTILGFVILAGVVVNNAILIVHQTLNFLEDARREGRELSARRAISDSVASRVRPILMSTLTSVGGMLPLVLVPGSGSELYRGLGAVVVGGLVVSTLFTLVLVPVLLSMTFDLLGVRLRRVDDEESVPAGGLA